MALFNYNELLQAEIPHDKSYDYNVSLESDNVTLDSIDMESYKSFDIFLSHSYSDKEIIPALKYKLEEMGYSVYVDWITDRMLSRDEVNKRTAEVLQKRMQQSKCLIYATSENSQKSRWMPWELGYFDGIKEKMVAILPIKKDNNNFENDFKGEEYLGLYYYVDKTSSSLWILENASKYVSFNNWLEGTRPYEK